jgi:hypothetical protein
VKHNYTTYGNALLVTLTLFAFLAIVGLSVFTTLQKTNLTEKAAGGSTCGSITDMNQCSRTAGCSREATSCSVIYSSTGVCPSANCNLVDETRDCSDFNSSFEQCAAHSEYVTTPGAHCNPTYSTPGCSGATNKPSDRSFCQNRDEGFCNDHGDRCRWDGPRYVSCLGRYLTGTKLCNQRPGAISPQICTRCTCANGQACLPPDTYHTSNWCPLR